MELLFIDRLVRVEHDPALAAVVLTRSAARPRDAEELIRSLTAFVEVTAPLRPGCALVVDLRQAPGDNRPDFEAALRPARRRVHEGFTRSVVVLQTAAGALQMERLAQRHGVRPDIAHSLLEARHLLAPPPSRSPPDARQKKPPARPRRRQPRRPPKKPPASPRGVEPVAGVRARDPAVDQPGGRPSPIGF